VGKSKEDISFLFETRFINDRLTVCTGERKQIAFVERMNRFMRKGHCGCFEIEMSLFNL